MTNYFVGSLIECNSLISKMDNIMGYPNPATKTDTYAIPRKHVSLANTYFVIIKEVHAPRLGRKIMLSEMTKDMSTKEKTWKNRDILKSEGAFPVSIV